MPRSRLLVIVAIAAIAVGVGGFIVYDQVLRGDSAAALTLPTASTSPATSTAPGASTVPAASFDGSVAGTWNVATDSVAGYRVREQLASLPAESDAVGRTSAVSGSITLETSGSTTTLTAGQITVDTTSIASDKPQRDGRLRNEGLQTDTYPTATFKLTKAVAVPAAALAGIFGAEFDPADRRTRDVAKARIKHVLVTGTRRRIQSQQDDGKRQSLPLSPEPKHCGPRFLLGPRLAQRFCAAAK